MYNLTEYSKNYRKTTGSLWNYYRFEPTYPIADSKSFRYKTSILWKTVADGTTKKVEIAVLLKCFSNFWRTLDLPLINCEVSLILTWSENCVITDELTRDADLNANPPIEEIRAPAGATFNITDSKL